MSLLVDGTTRPRVKTAAQDFLFGRRPRVSADTIVKSGEAAPQSSVHNFRAGWRRGGARWRKILVLVSFAANNLVWRGPTQGRELAVSLYSMSCGLWIPALEQNITRTHHRPPCPSDTSHPASRDSRRPLGWRSCPRLRESGVVGVLLKPFQRQARVVALGGGGFVADY